MQEKIILNGQGVLIGVSTAKAYPGKSLSLYDGNKLILGQSLDKSYPTGRNNVPGIECFMFIRQRLIMRYPVEAEDDIQVFVGRG